MHACQVIACSRLCGVNSWISNACNQRTFIAACLVCSRRLKIGDFSAICGRLIISVVGRGGRVVKSSFIDYTLLNQVTIGSDEVILNFSDKNCAFLVKMKIQLSIKKSTKQVKFSSSLLVLLFLLLPLKPAL